MILQLSYGVVLVLAAFIILCVILLIAVTPKAARDYKEYARRLKRTKKVELGDSLTTLLERLTTCAKEDAIRDLIEKIRAEAKKATGDKGEYADHAHTVLRWLDYFEIDRHINDLKRTKESSQIRYEASSKDFKLLIPSREEEEL